jgi:hypothetical protein
MSDDLRSVDRAMLLALSHRQDDNTPLSLDQERLLDSWIADRLPPIDADRAAELTKHNRFAAERILERRLISAANEGPDVPSTLAAQILRASRPPRTGAGGIFNLRWPALSGWQWSGLGAALAATAVIAVFGFQLWQAQLRPDQSFQIAMVTIEDRSVLAEGARRTRGPREAGVVQPQARSADASVSPPREAGAAPTPYDPVSQKSAKSRFRDFNIPTVLLRNAITSASNHKGDVERSELMNYLRAQNDAFNNRAHILIDSALAESLSGKPDERNSIQVRVYDLDDLRAANIRSKIKLLQADAHFILLTLKQ